MSNNDPVFPGVNDPSLADITVSEAKEVLGIDALVDQTELDTVEQNLESVDATLFASKADVSALTQEVIDRATADLALAAAKMDKPNGTTAQYVRGDGSLATLPPQVQADWTQANNAALDFIKNKPVSRAYASVTRPLVTVAAAANGFQISATQDALAFYSVEVNTTTTIGGAQRGTVYLEICPTNSTTAADWIVIAEQASGQTITIVLAIQSVQPVTSQVGGVVPAGYYARIRTVSNSGAPTFTFKSGRENKF